MSVVAVFANNRLIRQLQETRGFVHGAQGNLTSCDPCTSIAAATLKPIP